MQINNDIVLIKLERKSLCLFHRKPINLAYHMTSSMNNIRLINQPAVRKTVNKHVVVNTSYTYKLIHIVSNVEQITMSSSS